MIPFMIPNTARRLIHSFAIVVLACGAVRAQMLDPCIDREDEPFFCSSKRTAGAFKYKCRCRFERYLSPAEPT